MSTNLLTLDGHLTADPELKFTPSGAAVVNFTVAHTPRRFDRASNEWKDEDTVFLPCSLWRDAAENVAESLQRGSEVLVVGKLKARSYTTREGESRTVLELAVDTIGPSLRKATARVTKATRDGGQVKSGNVQTPPAGGWGTDDPWATGTSSQGENRQTGPGYDEPPF